MLLGEDAEPKQTESVRSSANTEKYKAKLFREGAVECTDDRFDRGEFNVGVDTGTVKRETAFGLDLNITHSAGFGAAAKGVFAVIEYFKFRQRGGSKGADEGVNRAVAAAVERVVDAVKRHRSVAGDRAVALGGFKMLEHERRRGLLEVLVAENGVDLCGRELGALGVGAVVDEFADFLVHELRQLEAEVVFENVRDAAFAGLAVDADDGFVTATEVGGVDRYIDHVPRRVGFLAGPGFLYGVLVRAAKSREDQFAGVGLARRHFEFSATLVDVAHVVDVGEIKARVDAVGVEIQRYGDDVEIAGAFTIAEERAFDAISTSEQG